MTSGSLRNKQERFAPTPGVRLVVTSMLIALFFVFAFIVPAHANPYLPKPGERSVKLRIATARSPVALLIYIRLWTMGSSRNTDSRWNMFLSAAAAPH